ncbi:hypothetical protein BOTBODRAFT_38451, partial [Botryobasidium botryosum FD-172 SS1]
MNRLRWKKRLSTPRRAAASTPSLDKSACLLAQYVSPSLLLGLSGFKHSQAGVSFANQAPKGAPQDKIMAGGRWRLRRYV